MNTPGQLAELLSVFASLPLEELKFKNSECEFHIKRSFSSSTPTGIQTAPQIETVAVVPSVAQSPAPKVETVNYHVQASPLVGTYYGTSAPGQANFTQVGAKVKKGDPLCIVEAMKVMNTIESDVDGEVIAILATSGEVVQYGTALFHILPD